MRVFFQLGTAISLAWIAVPAAAQTSDPNLKTCEEKSGDEAIAGCTAAITSGKLSTADLAITFYNRGIEWSNKHDYAHAITDYTEAIRLNPQLAQAFNNRGIAYDNLNDYARAIADYSEAIRLNPKYALALYGRGLAKAGLGQSAGSKADMARALAIDPHIAQRF